VTLAVAGELRVTEGEAQGEASPFTLSLDFTADARFTPAEPRALLRVEAGEPLALFLDVSRWFEGVDIGACVSAGDITPDDAGVLVIERARSRCQGIMTTVRDNIRGSGRVRP
jgi:hypothetical protein